MIQLGETLRAVRREFSKKRSIQLDRFDLIFIADSVNHSRVLRRARTDDDTRRVHLMQRSGDDVPDPWYGGTQDFVEAFDLIDLACDDILVEVRAQLNNK